MRIDVVTLFPELVGAVAQHGVVGRAISSGIASLQLWQLRDFASDRHRTVDDAPYGGGPGMVLKAEPMLAAIAAARAASDQPVRVAYVTPQGRRFDHAAAQVLAKRPRLLVLCGRYEGVDERALELAVDEEWSCGDYVLSGGELPAMVMIDAIVRLLPGALGDAESAVQDSFVHGLLDHPHYTRPQTLGGQAVPPVLIGGDHERVRKWRLQQALARTWRRRPDLLDRLNLTDEQQRLLDEYRTQADADGRCPALDNQE
ncbi:tRNA (guanosine(37)-N1)-methyltransferase TrmD [Immundisolibacter sp.]|uniref:tRNA (guanosine(37)-N1)-methyltransferase TrmD n=1 Tax=Immundisolibacter sp. TaxID=1934948 RepID=UPI003569C1E2